MTLEVLLLIYMIEKKLAFMSYIPNVVIYQTFMNEMIIKYLEENNG
jgi:hypothetical protein